MRNSSETPALARALANEWRNDRRAELVPVSVRRATLLRLPTQEIGVWSREDAKTLLDSIPKDSVCGLRIWRLSPQCSTASPE
jgi:hypothetical protein